MRLVLTRDDRLGAERDGSFVDVSAVFDDIRYRSAADRMPRVLAVLAERRARFDEAVANGRPAPLPDLQTPVPRPPKLIAVVGGDRPEAANERAAQDMFLLSPDSVAGPNGTVVLPNHPASGFQAEAELALVIGRRAKDLPADERALEAVIGLTCAIDVAALGLGRIGPSRIGASFDSFTPLGPAIVSIDEVADPRNLRVTLTVNGETRQDYATGDLEYGVVESLAFISSYMTLVPGDVILCGSSRPSAETLRDGDHLAATIEGIGTLAATVRDSRHR